MLPSKAKPPTNIWIPGQGSIPEPEPSPTPSSSYFSWLSDASKTKLSNTAEHFYSGFKQGFGLPSVVPAVFKSSSLLKVEAQVLKANLLYLGIAMGMDYVRDKLTTEEKNDDTLHPMNWVVAGGMFTLSSLVFIRFLLNNSIDYLSVAAAVRKESLPHLEEHTCLCDINASIPGLLNDPVSNLFGVARLMVLGMLPVVGPVGARVYGSIIYGNALIQTKLSMCLTHRRDYVREHIFSVAGYGASFLFQSEMSYLLLWALTGRDGFLMYDALFCLIYSQFIIHAHVAELDFPVDPLTFDPSYLDRRRTDAYLKDLAPAITAAFAPNKPSLLPIETVKSIMHSPFIRHWLNLDTRSLESTLKNPSIHLLVELIQPTLMKVIDGIEEIPQNNGVWIGNKIHKWGKLIGVTIPGTDIAAILRDLTKKGFFSPDFLEPIRATINSAVQGQHLVRISKNTSQANLDAHLHQEPYKEEKPPVVTGPIQTDPEAETSLTRRSTKARTRVKLLSKDPLTINDDYVGASSGKGAATLTK